MLFRSTTKHKLLSNGIVSSLYSLVNSAEGNLSVISLFHILWWKEHKNRWILIYSNTEGGKYEYKEAT